uniref:Multimerin 2 n=1 Tax=Cyprinodon variegatus TaxID=28743 RepID=A0A3Q2CEU9_CYPVA
MLKQRTRTTAQMVPWSHLHVGVSLRNRCAFQQKEVVTVTEECRKVVKQRGPCPSGSPSCTRITYRWSTQPTLCQKEKVLTALVWRCCPGRGGPNCEEEVSGLQTDSSGSEPEGTKVQFPGDQVGLQLQQHGDPNREQSDYQTSFRAPQSSAHPDSGHAPTHHHLPIYRHHHLHHQGQNQPPSMEPTQVTDDRVPRQPDFSVQTVMVLVVSQLQPILQGFNRSLELLQQQVGALVQDVSELKSGGLEADQQGVSEAELDSKLDAVFRQIGDVRRQVEEQRSNMEKEQEERLHSLSSLKVEVDQVQVSLQAMNASLSGTELDLIPEEQAEAQLHPQQPADNTALWDAITRLDRMVINNTVKVDELMEEVEASSAQELETQLKDLEKLINQTARKSQILFMETGLEVEQSKVSVLRRVEELAGNLTLQQQQLKENSEDVDFLYTDLHNLSIRCNFDGLKATLTHLERGVANVTQLANENRLALEENSQVGGAMWDSASDWEPAVEALQRGLQQVAESMASEQNRTRILDRSLTHLSSSVSALQEGDVQRDNQVKTLSVSFRSLLQDAIRHSDVLQLLLGEEVLEFLEWPIQDQEAHSIPALKEQIRELQEQLRSKKEAKEKQDKGAGSPEEVPSADQPPSQPLWPPGGSSRNSGGPPVRENQLLLLHPHAGDGSDLWNLEKNVEQLEQRLVRLEERPCSCNNTPAERGTPPAGRDVQLQKDVELLKRGLEEHLRVFKNVFSKADVLAASEDTVELDRLWELMKRKDKKRGGRGKSGGGGHRRERRAAGVPFPSSQSDVSLLFVGGAPRGAADGGISFEPSLNMDHCYSDSGVFSAPVDGLYLFILTSDLRPGSTHVVLRRVEERGGALVSLRQQEVKEAGPVSSLGLLQLRQGEKVKLEATGEWAESQSNLLAVLLLQQTT